MFDKKVTLNLPFWITPLSMLFRISRRMANIAMLVLPAPVGAEMRRFSLVQYAAWKTTDWIRFSDLVPLKASWAMSSSSLIFFVTSPTDGGRPEVCGMWISSMIVSLCRSASAGIPT